MDGTLIIMIMKVFCVSPQSEKCHRKVPAYVRPVEQTHTTRGQAYNNLFVVAEAIANHSYALAF